MCANKKKGGGGRREDTYAVDHQELSAHVLTGVAREEDDGSGKVARLAPPAGGYALRDLTETHGVLEELLVPKKFQQHYVQRHPKCNKVVRSDARETKGKTRR